MKICNDCNAENTDDVKFCKECGKDMQNNTDKTNRKYGQKKTIFVAIASVVLLAILVSVYNFIIGADKRRTRKQLEEMGIHHVDKEWYEYSIENILEYEDRLSVLEDELKNNDFENFSKKADIVLQIELCKDNLQSGNNKFSAFQSRKVPILRHFSGFCIFSGYKLATYHAFFVAISPSSLFATSICLFG